MLNIAVLVSGGGTNLQALINAQAAEEIHNGRIALVVSSNSRAGALVRAEKAGIPSAVLVHGNFSAQKDYDEALLDLFNQYKIDLIVLAGFLTIVSNEVVEKYRNRILNVHPSLLPSFGGEGYYGLHVHEAALKRGVKVTGATVHFVNEVCDEGPIILQKAVEVLPGDTPQTLQRRVMEQAEWKLLPKAVSLFCEDRLSVKDGIVTIREAQT